MLFAGALVAAGRWPSFRVSFLILTAGFGARAAALAMNRIIDKDIDLKNPRTASRELPSGAISLLQAWGVAMAGVLVYLLSAWLLNDFCLRLSWIPLSAFVIYPYLKRFTHWSHLGLGLVWSLAPLGGYLAVKSSFEGSGPAFLLSAFSLFWLAGFDIIYATLDEEFDKAHGLFSLPAKVGSQKALRISALFHLLAFFFLAIFYTVHLAGPITVLLLLISGFLLYLEHRMAYDVDLAFFKINAVTGFLILALVLSGLKGI